MSPTEAKFKRFCAAIGLELEDWQDLVIAEFFSGRREVLFSCPRGAGKTTLCAALALFELLRDPDAAIVCAAASREQAGHLFEQARKFALRSDSIRKRLRITRRELRSPSEGRLLVIAADAEKQLGWDPSMIFIDELGSHKNDSLYSNLRTALVKRPDAKMRVISTAGIDPEGPLAALRQRALEQGEIERDGPLTVARGEHLGMVEWAAPEDWPLERFHEANPASWVTEDAVAEMLASAVPELRLRRLIGNQWVAAEDSFITPDEWDANDGGPDIPEGSSVVIGVDASIRHDCTSVVVVRRDHEDVYHALWRVWQPTKRHEVPLRDVEQFVADLAGHFNVEAVMYDARFFVQAAQNLEERGVPMLEWQHSRMPAAVNTLREVIVNGRLRHGGDEIARSHALAAETVEREYGVILTKRKTREPNDALVSLAMAVEWAAALKPARRSAYSGPDPARLVVA